MCLFVGDMKKKNRFQMFGIRVVREKKKYKIKKVSKCLDQIAYGQVNNNNCSNLPQTVECLGSNPIVKLSS